MVGEFGGFEMNCDTGELRRLQARLSSEEQELLFKQFTQVPEEFAEEANKLLGSEESIFVYMDENTPLVNWARCNRKERREKQKQRCKRKRK